ncbi:MAG: hypothetical protein NTW21_17660 [Verrucomicrobia bacterium]|nr:hypothetical protein [Verrucomicrobiota bacterium]
MSESSTPQRECYPNTRWSLLTRAAGGDDAVAMKALDELARIYQRPVYLSVVARGYPREDAEDHTQSFLAAFIHAGSFQRADPAQGRLRCYLSRALSNFLNKARRTERRAPPQTQVQDWSASDPNAPDLEFDRCWARELFSKATHRLAQEHSHTAAAKHRFAALLPLLPATPAPGLITQAAATLEMTESAVRKATSDLRHRLRALLEAEVRETVTPAEFDSELAYLIELLQTRTPPGSHEF